MVFDREIITQSAQETQKLGKELGHWVRKRQASSVKRERGDQRHASVVCLFGELGGGKTTFAQGFAKGLGITSRLLSPTFIIVRRYPISKNPGFLYHIDLYRVAGKKDLQGLGLPEILADPDSVVLIEWAEKLESLLPRRRIDIRFSVKKDESHCIGITKLT